MVGLTVQERFHLRGALGSMFRGENGVIQIHPNPEQSGALSGPGRFALRRNASKKVVQALIDKGCLAETPHRFEVTALGRTALDAAGG